MEITGEGCLVFANQTPDRFTPCPSDCLVGLKPCKVGRLSSGRKKFSALREKPKTRGSSGETKRGDFS